MTGYHPLCRLDTQVRIEWEAVFMCFSFDVGVSLSGSKKKVKFLAYKDGKMVEDSDDEDDRDQAGDEQTQAKGSNLYAMLKIPCPTLPPVIISGLLWNILLKLSRVIHFWGCEFSDGSDSEEGSEEGSEDESEDEDEEEEGGQDSRGKGGDEEEGASSDEDDAMERLSGKYKGSANVS